MEKLSLFEISSCASHASKYFLGTLSVQFWLIVFNDFALFIPIYSQQDIAKCLTLC